MAGPLVIISSKASQYMAELISEKIGECEQLGLERRIFGDGEKYYRLHIADKKDLMGRDAIYVGGTHTDDDFLELIRVGHALAEYGTHRRLFVMPFFGYSTMEKAANPGEVVTTKVQARLLSSIPNSGAGNVFLMMDLHSPATTHYFDGDCLCFELHSEQVLIEALDSLGLRNFMFASADMGRPLLVQHFADRFRTGIAFISKMRHFEETKVVSVVGDVEGKNVVIADDMCRSGDSLANACEAYLERGAKSVYAVLCHLALNNEKAAEKLIDSPIEKIISTNTHPMSQIKSVQESKKFEIADVSGIFSSAIKKI